VGRRFKCFWRGDGGVIRRIFAACGSLNLDWCGVLAQGEHYVQGFKGKSRFPGQKLASNFD